MHDPIFKFIQTHQLFSDGSTIVLGLSGGPDSMFLLHILAPLHQTGKIKLIAAHLDHGWRTNSAHDAQFCVQQAQKLGITCVIEQLENLQHHIPWNGSQEELGRKARRFFLEMVAHAHGASHIALAHHAQDQEETFFIRLLRGSSLAGLSCMRPRNGIYIRPLLATSKKDILAYLDTHQIAYLIDETNTSPDYLRNRIRYTVIPALQQSDARFDANFATTLARLQSASDFLSDLGQHTLSQISRAEKETLQLNTSSLCVLHPALQQYVVITWLTRELVSFTPTQSFFEEIIRFAQNPAGGTHQIHHSWALVKKKGWIWVQK